MGRGPTADLRELVVDHFPSGRRPHHDANLAVLLGACSEYPGDHRMTFYLGRELWYGGRWAECRTVLTQFLDLPGGWPPERSEAWRILGLIDDRPERWLWRAIGECPERREPWVDLARHFLAAGASDDARRMWEMARRRTDDAIYPTDPDAWGPAFDALGAEIG